MKSFNEQKTIVKLFRRLFLPVFALIISGNVSAQNLVDFLISPQNTTVIEGETFTVDVRADIISGSLDAAEVHLNFSTTFLEVVSITTTNLLPLTVISIAPLATINSSGQIDYAGGTFSNFPSADFNILTIIFRAKMTDLPAPIGGTTIAFNSVFPRQTDATRSGLSILRTTVNGTVFILNSGPLPIELLSLRAKSQNKHIILFWETGSETNNYGFEIERSVDGLSWSTIGFVAGAGNSTQKKSYNYIDEGLSPRRYIYRLKQIDQTAGYTYSYTVSAKILGSKLFELDQNYPNPYSGITIIEFTLGEDRDVKITLLDVQGKLVRLLLKKTMDAGTHHITVNSANLAKGQYFFRLEAGDFSETKRMLVK